MQKFFFFSSYRFKLVSIFATVCYFPLVHSSRGKSLPDNNLSRVYSSQKISVGKRGQKLTDTAMNVVRAKYLYNLFRDDQSCIFCAVQSSCFNCKQQVQEIAFAKALKISLKKFDLSQSTKGFLLFQICCELSLHF